MRGGSALRSAARLLAVLAAMIPAGPALAAPGAASPYTDWAVVVAAGDDRAAHEDKATAAFDNARRAVVAALIEKGFSAGAIAQLSVDPERYPEDHAARSSVGALYTELSRVANHAAAGCLVYVTSHGSPQGVVLGDQLAPPAVVADIVRRACGRRPTAVILSACFSGVFIPALAGSDRLVFTAARRDRSSFGCGESDRYPFFDGCLIAQAPRARDFLDLADRVKTCVASREDEEGMRPRSRPQLFVGAAFRQALRPFAPIDGHQRGR